jgi:DNA-binding XRE family transcriptional regulator
MSDWRDDILHDMGDEERAAVEREGRKIAGDARTIAEIRKALSMTQSQVARTLEITQGALSQMEKRDDMMVSTVQSYIEALGGELKMVVEFPGMSPFELSLGDTPGERRSG